MDAISAESYAKSWTEAWNVHDLDRLMDHYSENVEFHSPFISVLDPNAQSPILGKSNLRNYFAKGMEAYPHVRFQLHRTGLGDGSIVLNYISLNGMLANEVHVLDAEDRAVEVRCHYSETVA